MQNILWINQQHYYPHELKLFFLIKTTRLNINYGDVHLIHCINKLANESHSIASIRGEREKARVKVEAPARHPAVQFF